MSNFPKLVPAFTAQIHVAPPTSFGGLTAGPSLVHLPFVSGAGGLKSEPGYPVQLDAVFAHGADYAKLDKKSARLEVQSTLKNKADGAALRYNYTGIGDLAKPGGKILRGESDAATTEFDGGLFGWVQFEAGSPALQALENKVFVQSGRFVVEEGKPVIVEYKISEVVN